MVMSPKVAKKKKRLAKKRQREEMLIRNHLSLYTKYRNRGFTHDKAIIHMKKELTERPRQKGTKSLEILKHRYLTYKEMPSIKAISLQGIPRTKAVDSWIGKMESQGQLIDMGYQLKYPRDESLGRY